MEGPNNPHDSLFKSAFSRVNIARDYITQFLPAAIVSRLHLRTLKLENTSYIDQNLKPYYSDIIYSCAYGDREIPVKIILLFEHKSSVPDSPHLQVLRYMLECWDEQVKQKLPLAPVIPIIIYHGKQKWHKKPFQDYIEGIDEILEPFFPSFEYYLTDLSKYSDEEIVQLNLGFLRIIFILFKKYWDKGYIRKNIKEITIVLSRPELLKDRNLIKVLFVYLTKMLEIQPEEYEEIKQQISEPVRDIFMTTYDMIIQKGIQQGIQQTNQKKDLRVIKKGLEEGLSIELLAKLTGLSGEEVKEIIAKLTNKV